VSKVTPIRSLRLVGRNGSRSETPVIDLRRVFDALPTPMLVLSPLLVIVDVNDAYLVTTSRTRDDLIGRVIFEAFPANPDAPSDGVANLRASLERVTASREPDSMELQRYDVADPDSGKYRERYWSATNIPVVDEDGVLELIVHRVVELSDLVPARDDFKPLTNESLRAARDLMQAELVARAAMLRDAVEGLRAVHERDEQRSSELSEALAYEANVAATLQHTMLPHAPEPIAGTDLAARYLPANVGLEVGGDWFDVIDIGDGRIGVVVGDVVGRGLNAAAVMGQLRSATSAAVVATQSPSRALGVLDRIALSIEGAGCATAFSAMVDLERSEVTYSSAGHLPALILDRDGHCELLDRAQSRPLGVHLDDARWTEAAASFPRGSTLVLYTDGLVERRREAIDIGIERLTDCLTAHRDHSCHDLANVIIAALSDEEARDDDIALIVLRRV
jgi:serine phosphatase RsbU (regulator of sigma subunit)